MATDLRTIFKLRVPVIVQIGERRIALQDVLALGPGAIIELTKPSDADLSLLVNNKTIGEGEAVKIGENFGIRLKSVGNATERIEAMGA